MDALNQETKQVRQEYKAETASDSNVYEDLRRKLHCSILGMLAVAREYGVRRFQWSKSKVTEVSRG